MRDAGPAELLLERDRELDSLRSVLSGRRGRRGRLALVEGPAGHREEPAARGAAEGRGGGRRAGAHRARQRARARVPVRGRAAALRAARSRTARLASAGWPAPPRPRGRSSRPRTPAPTGWPRRHLRGAPRPLLADRERRGRRAAAAVGGRPALVRPAVAALPRLPRAPARGHARARGRHAAQHRPRHRSRPDRRDRPRPGSRTPYGPARSAAPPSPSWCARGSARTPTSASARPARA